MVAFFIDVILPNLKFAIKKSQCDSYIRLFKKIVKEKMYDMALFVRDDNRGGIQVEQ